MQKLLTVLGVAGFAMSSALLACVALLALKLPELKGQLVESVASELPELIQQAIGESYDLFSDPVQLPTETGPAIPIGSNPLN